MQNNANLTSSSNDRLKKTDRRQNVVLVLTIMPLLNRNDQSLASPITKIYKKGAAKCTKWGGFEVVRDHSRSLTMSPFNRAHTTSYSSLIETMRLSCTVFEIQPVICRNSPTLPYPTSIWRPRMGWPRSNFEKIFGIRRVPGLSCRVVCVILFVAVLIPYRLVTDGRTDGRTDTQTHDDS